MEEIIIETVFETWVGFTQIKVRAGVGERV